MKLMPLLNLWLEEIGEKRIANLQGSDRISAFIVGDDFMVNHDEINKLETEAPNPRSVNVDTMSASEIAHLMNEEDKKVAFAVEKELEKIAVLAEKIKESIKRGGRCFYVGAGTSGRLGVIDAAETVPTFNVEPGLFTALIAGGEEAMVKAVENVEDDENAGAEELKHRGVSSKDVVVGISASGRTPYVVGAIKVANDQKALTACVVNVKNSKLSNLVDIPIEVLTGPEVIAGSTRLKAGTAQKMVLNMLSTISMIRLGKVYKNLMVDLTPINGKLITRAINIISKATGLSNEESYKLLKESKMRPKVAIVMALTGKNAREAEKLLKENDWMVRKACK